MAEAAEVERTADWVFGLWQSRTMRDFNRCYLQTLASRREDLLDWSLIWRPWNGEMRIEREIDLRTEDES